MAGIAEVAAQRQRAGAEFVQADRAGDGAGIGEVCAGIARIKPEEGLGAQLTPRLAADAGAGRRASRCPDRR